MPRYYDHQRTSIIYSPYAIFELTDEILIDNAQWRSASDATDGAKLAEYFFMRLTQLANLVSIYLFVLNILI